MENEISQRRNEILELIDFLMSEKKNGNSITKRAFAINKLEKMTRSNFSNSKEFEEGLVEIQNRIKLAIRLEEKRIGEGLTIAQLAKRLGIVMGAKALGEMEKGTRKLSVKVLKYLGEEEKDEPLH